MEMKNLKKHVRTLATLPETDAVIISCYLALAGGRVKNPNAFKEQVEPLAGILTCQARQDFQDALDPIGKYLAEELLPGAKGTAIFSRAGSDPFFLPLQFRVPLPNWIAVDRVPNIYHLVELKDNYERYVVMIGTEKMARIVEINLGEVTRHVWDERPEIRERVGREWTKNHYQRHGKEQTRKFIKEKIEVLDRLMSAGATPT